MPYTLMRRPRALRRFLSTHHLGRSVAAFSALGLLTAAACRDDALSPRTEGPDAAGPRADITAEAPPNSWVTRASMPTPARGLLVAAAVNGVVYAIGGMNASEIALRRVDAYYPNTTTMVAWYPKAPLPEARYSASGAVVINNKIYVPGGRNADGAFTKTLYVYTPATNSWTQKANLPVVSGDGAAAAINGKLYVFTPANLGASGAPPYLHRYDPSTNSWTELATPPHGHVGVVAGAMNGKFYLAGGYKDGVSSKLYMYDPATDQWTTKADMPTPRFAAAARVLNGKFYVVGGSDGGPAVSTLEVYDPTTNTWATKASMPTPRWNLAAAVANGVLYVIGGTDTYLNPLTTNEAYTP